MTNSADSIKILFVINPSSGNKKTDWETVIRNYFKQLSYPIEFFLVNGSDKTDALKDAINKMKPQRAVAVGGDGTVTMLAKQLLGTPISMGIIPAGSANGMAKELGIPDDVTKALDIITEGNTRSADAILLNDKDISIHLSDVGMNAQLVKYFEDGSLRGKLGYARVVLKVLFRKRRLRVTIVSKNEDLKRSAVMIALANASKYGTGAIINPDGSLYDGLFEVVIVRRLGLLEILKMFLKFQRFNPKNIEVIQAKSVMIETSSHVHFQIDGEYIGKVKSVTAKILPGQLNLLIPDEQKKEK